MLKAYKYRLYPTIEQSVLIDKHIDACRFVYNLALETKMYAYSAHRVNLTRYDLIGQLPELKKQCEWLKEVDSQSLQQSIINLDKAFSSFFKNNSKYPRFRCKKSSGSFKNPHGGKVSIKGDKISLPMFRDGIQFYQDREIDGVIKQSIVSKTKTNKYFVCLLVDNRKPLPIKVEISESTSIGIDLGLSHFAITSNGYKMDNPTHLKKAIPKLKYLQRLSAKKKKGSNNRKKANYKIAILHEKISNRRKDFLHKLSTKLISENQTICLEDLNVKGMAKNHNLAQSISDAGWSMFVSMCKYKAEWSGKNILQIPTFEPSTKICSSCGYTNRELTLKDREWTCICGVHHDRDINAAINIKNYCMKEISGGVRRKKVAELPTMVGAMKQQLIPSIINNSESLTLSND